MLSIFYLSEKIFYMEKQNMDSLESLEVGSIPWKATLESMFYKLLDLRKTSGENVFISAGCKSVVLINTDSRNKSKQTKLVHRNLFSEHCIIDFYLEFRMF